MEGEDINLAEHELLKYMVSRQYIPELANNIIQYSENRNKAQYMGSYYLPLEDRLIREATTLDLLNKTNRDINLDIIYSNYTRKLPRPTKKFGTYQSIFRNLNEFTNTRRPSPGKIGIYLIGELHDNQGFIHWNIFFLDVEQNKLTYFDPATSEESEAQYDFHSTQEIVESFRDTYNNKNLKLYQYTTIQRPQYICMSGLMGVDRFCQTWVLMFLDVFCNNKIGEFARLNFMKYQTQIIKTWVICTFNRFNIPLLPEEGSNIRKDFKYCISVNPKEPYSYTITDNPIVCKKFNKSDYTACLNMIINNFKIINTS